MHCLVAFSADFKVVEPTFAWWSNPSLLSKEASNLENQTMNPKKVWYLIAEKTAPAPHFTHPERCAALRDVLVTVPRASRSCEHFPDGFNLHLLLNPWTHSGRNFRAPDVEQRATTIIEFRL